MLVGRPDCARARQPWICSKPGNNKRKCKCISVMFALGAMGSALARRLLEEHTLSVWGINSAAVATFEKLSALVAPSAAVMSCCCVFRAARTCTR